MKNENVFFNPKLYSLCVQREIHRKMRALVLINNPRSIRGVLTQRRRKMKPVQYKYALAFI